MIRPHEKKLTADRLHELLSYRASDGVFTRLATRRIGQRAGSRTRYGSRVICLDGAKYDSLRLAYLAENGCWPDGAVIPADGNLDNAAVENLKLVPEINPSELQHQELTPELVRKLFELRNGKLHWAVNGYPGSRIRYGKEAGNEIAPHPGYANNGLRVVGIGKKKTNMVSRLIYALTHGEIPTGCEVVRQDGEMVKRKLRKRHRYEMTGRFASSLNE